jgi:hypothetical protein
MAGRSSRSTEDRAAGLLPKAGRSSRRQSRPTRPCIQGMNGAELLARVLALAAVDAVALAFSFAVDVRWRDSAIRAACRAR